jgi:mRNA interferase MazF
MNLTPKRYDIYLADLNPTIGGEIQKTWPVVVCSQNDMNHYLETIVICPLTTNIHPTWRCRLQITCAGKDAEIAIDQIRAISSCFELSEFPLRSIYILYNISLNQN